MDYSKVTMVEYQEKKRKIFESLGAIDGRSRCIGIKCDNCPFSNEVDCIVSSDVEYNETFKAIKTVMGYEIPIDWSKVEVDTPILVKSSEMDNYIKRYFAGYENGSVKAFVCGCTNWSGDGLTENWVYAKLANTGSEEQK